MSTTTCELKWLTSTWWLGS